MGGIADAYGQGFSASTATTYTPPTQRLTPTGKVSRASTNLKGSSSISGQYSNLFKNNSQINQATQQLNTQSAQKPSGFQGFLNGLIGTAKNAVTDVNKNPIAHNIENTVGNFAQGVGGAIHDVTTNPVKVGQDIVNSTVVQPATTLFKQGVIGAANNNGTNKDIVAMQNKYIQSQVKAGNISQNAADTKIAVNNQQAAKNTQAVSTAEKQTGVQQNQNAGANALINLASLAGAPEALSDTVIGKVGAKILGKNAAESAVEKVPAVTGVLARANKNAVENVTPEVNPALQEAQSNISEPNQTIQQNLPSAPTSKGSSVVERAINDAKSKTPAPEPLPEPIQEPVAQLPQTPVTQPHIMSPDEQNTLKSLNTEAETRVLAPEEKDTQSALQAKQDAIQEINKPASEAAPETTSFAPLDETTQAKTSALKAQSDSTPVPEGNTRLYQMNDKSENGVKSDQYFKSPDELANYANGRSDNADLTFKDVPTENVKSVPGKPTVFKVEEKPIASEVPTEKPVTSESEGNKISGPAQRIANKALDMKLTDKYGDLPQFKGVNIKEQRASIEDFIQNHRQEAENVIDGTGPIPEGMHPQLLHSILEDTATKEANGPLLDKLAHSDINTELSKGAQSMRLSQERDPDSPVEAVKQIKNAKKAVAEKRAGTTVEKETQKAVQSVKKSTIITTKDQLNDFIKGLQCN